MKEVAVWRHDGVSSDGHLAHVFRHAAKELFGEHVEEITYRALRFEPAYLQLCTQERCFEISQSQGVLSVPVCRMCSVPDGCGVHGCSPRGCSESKASTGQKGLLCVPH